MERAYTHSLRDRTVHWINASIVTLMLWSGFSMFAGDRHFAWIVRLLPAAFWHALHFAGTKRELFLWHVYAGTFFGINGLAFVASLLVNGGWRRFVQTFCYEVPQRTAYTLVMCGAALMVVTGAALWFKHQIPWLIGSLGGERIVLPVHVTLATSLIAFVVIHIVQVLRRLARPLGWGGERIRTDVERAHPRSSTGRQHTIKERPNAVHVPDLRPGRCDPNE